MPLAALHSKFYYSTLSLLLAFSPVQPPLVTLISLFSLSQSMQAVGLCLAFFFFFLCLLSCVISRGRCNPYEDSFSLPFSSLFFLLFFSSPFLVSSSLSLSLSFYRLCLSIKRMPLDYSWRDGYSSSFSFVEKKSSLCMRMERYPIQQRQRQKYFARQRTTEEDCF